MFNTRGEPNPYFRGNTTISRFRKKIVPIYMTIRNVFAGVKSVNANILYAVKLRGVNEIDFASSDDCIRKWPAQTLMFLEKNIIFLMPPQGMHFNLLTTINRDAAQGLPASVLACTNILEKVQYFCQWPNGFSRKLIDGMEHPKTAIRFLESKINFNVAGSSRSSSFRGKFITFLVRTHRVAIQIVFVVFFLISLLSITISPLFPYTNLMHCYMQAE